MKLSCAPLRRLRLAPAILTLGAVVFPVVSLAAPAPHAAHLASPKTAVLHLSDVTRLFGSGFTAAAAKPTARPKGAQMDTILGSTGFTRLAKDWVSGYSAEFDRSTSLAGSMNVTTTIDQFKTSGLAQQTYQATFAARAALAKHAGAPFFTSAMTHYSGVGQYAELTTNVAKPGKNGKPPALPGSYQATITFTRGHYLASLKIVSGSKINMSTALSAARIVDNRLHGG